MTKRRIPSWQEALEVHEPPSPADAYFLELFYQMTLMTNLLTDVITRCPRASRQTRTSVKYSGSSVSGNRKQTLSQETGIHVQDSTESCTWITSDHDTWRHGIDNNTTRTALRNRQEHPQQRPTRKVGNRQQHPPTPQRRRGMIGLMEYKHKKIKKVQPQEDPPQEDPLILVLQEDS